MAKKSQTAITPTRLEDYPTWYQEVIKAAELADNSPVRGCMVIRPWGYAIWERVQARLDRMFKETGHVNAYFPLFIPLSYLEKEAEHVEGFAKECAVVTHHRLEDDGKGGLKPAGELDEPLVVRPTSETIIGAMYSKWVQSYRDLPILMNQWANVVRWEMRTRMFLRTTEFLWQEGHTVHATSEEAQEETDKMLKVYSKFAHEFLGMPVIEGEKTEDERFPGAVSTFTIEGMMQDGKALQAGTSHFLGQNFAKASNIQFLNKKEERQFAWTTSWGVSTRLIGGLIMTHSDDNGLILPPKVAPQQIVISPIYKEDSRAEVMEYVQKLQKELSEKVYDEEKVRVHIDDRDIRGGEKNWGNTKKGYPIRVEVGPRDIAQNKLMVGRRDQEPSDKQLFERDEFVQNITATLEDIQSNIYNKAKKLRDDNSVSVSSKEEFVEYFKTGAAKGFTGFVKASWDSNHDISDVISELKVTARCIPLATKDTKSKCIFSGSENGTEVVFARSY